MRQSSKYLGYEYIGERKILYAMKSITVGHAIHLQWRRTFHEHRLLSHIYTRPFYDMYQTKTAKYILSIRNAIVRDFQRSHITQHMITLSFIHLYAFHIVWCPPPCHLLCNWCICSALFHLQLKTERYVSVMTIKHFGINDIVWFRRNLPV